MSQEGHSVGKRSSFRIITPGFVRSIRLVFLRRWQTYPTTNRSPIEAPGVDKLRRPAKESASPDVPWRSSLGKHRALLSNGPVSNALHLTILSIAEFTANTRSHTESFYFFSGTKVYRDCLILWDGLLKYECCLYHQPY